MDVKQIVRKEQIEQEPGGTRVHYIDDEHSTMVPRIFIKRLKLPAIVASAATLIGLFWLYSHWQQPATTLPTVKPSSSPADPSPRDVNTVRLTPEQIAAGWLEVAEVQQSAVQSTKTLPGRLVYNQERHVEVKSACDGILVAMPLRPGQRVNAGDVVAIVNSPEVGNARAEVRARASAEQLAEQKLKWLRDLDHGVQRLVQLIRASDSPESIEAQLASESLGRYRERLVGPYTRSLLARQVATKSRAAAAGGAIPGRIQKEREQEMRAAQAALASALEQSLFDARQEYHQARAAWQQARERLEVSRQQLKALLGPASDDSADDTAEPEASAVLSQVMLRAPLQGTLEARMLAEGERVAAGQTIVIVADTSQLWVEADVREGDWAAMELQVGDEVLVYTPAIPDAVFKAQVIVVGRFVNVSSGAVPLTSCLLHNDPRLRPGMFVRVEVPYGQARQSLSVADSAVVVHEGQTFVFAQTGPTTFRRVDVQTGETQGNRVEIRSGLQQADKVVVQGAFQLKSELLLATEEQ